jgi:transposase-like protein
MAKCQKCAGKARVIDTSRHLDGTVRRRYRCPSCYFAWTVLNGEAPPSAAPSERLADGIIRDILLSRETHVALSKRHGISASTVGQIRRGEMHANVLPEIARFTPSPKRRSKKTCKLCIHYTEVVSSPCDLGHPDPREEGLTYASECSTFIPA